jgi:hypothetical protein
MCCVVAPAGELCIGVPSHYFIGTWKLVHLPGRTPIGASGPPIRRLRLAKPICRLKETKVGLVHLISIRDFF